MKGSRPQASVARPSALLFVYGTLRPFAGTPIARWLAANAELLGPARTRGRLYDLGPYPALVDPRRRGEWVQGDLYRLQYPVAALRVLDVYEGGPNGRGVPQYARVQRVVERARAARVVAWTYLYRRSVLRARWIAGGDYFEARAMSVVGT